MLTHVNILVYVTIPFVHGDSICKALDICTYISKTSTKSNHHQYVFIILLFVGWNFFCLLQLRNSTENSFISLIPLYAEKFIIGLLETQICLLLYIVKTAVAQINEEIMKEVFRREVSLAIAYTFIFDALLILEGSKVKR